MGWGRKVPPHRQLRRKTALRAVCSSEIVLPLSNDVVKMFCHYIQEELVGQLPIRSDSFEVGFGNTKVAAASSYADSDFML